MERKERMPFMGKMFDIVEKSRADINAKTPFIKDTDVTKNVVYKEIDGKKLVMDIYVPKNAEETNAPAVMIIPGGGWMVNNRERRGGYASLYASLGAKVFVVEYRLTPGITFPENLKDLVDATDFIYENREKYGIDVDKFVVTGDSAGGHLAACLACAATTPGYAEKLGTRIPKIKPAGCIFISASFSFKTMCRIPVSYTFIVKNFCGLSTKTAFRKWKYYNESYPWNCITENFPKSYNSGGKSDPFCTGDAKRMADKLTEKGVENEYYIGKGIHADHCYVLRNPYLFARKDMLKIMTWYKKLLESLSYDFGDKFDALKNYLENPNKKYVYEE
ncbi:MAG: alpha/beta hydrolase [Christensenellales bacterium]